MPAVGCSTLVSCAAGGTPMKSPAQPEVTRDGVLAWEEEVVTYAGPRSGWTGSVDEDLAGRTIVPGFVDCHTHLPFVRWRDDEYEARLTGRTYRDLHGEGGIHRSARLLADSSDQEILDFCHPLLHEMLAYGTTAMELKTGYGLSVEQELRQARLARAVADAIPQTCTLTLLACHAVPDEWDREAWVETVCRDLIPQAVAEGLADAVDVYVEDIAFTVADLERVAETVAGAGLPLRVHADQLGHSAAAEAAVRLQARSADHLNHVGAAGVRALRQGSTAAVLLPASTLMLGATAPPVAALSEGGAVLALATDFNPGTSPVLSMPEAIAIGCALYRLAPLEALAAATVNAAWVLGLENRLGSLAPGKRADFLVLEGEDFRMTPYRPGHNPVVQTFVGGVASR